MKFLPAKIILISFIMLSSVALMIAYPCSPQIKKNDSIAQAHSSIDVIPRDHVLYIDIQMEPSEWNDMLDNAINEEYKIASIQIDNELYPYVKIRPKGNSSLNTLVGRHVSSEQQEKDQKSSNRFSFKISFDDINEMQTFHGITQLNLNNGFSDPSYMREYLAYQIYETMGLPVPWFCFAKISVNGEYHGLYLAVESILESYLVRNFDDASCDLYKSVGNSLAYTGSKKEDITGLECKSTRKNPDLDALHNFMKQLSTGSNLEAVFDVDGALRYIAVTTALANFDSYLGPFAHNYYLAQVNGKFTILPWDLNMAFGGFHMGSSDSVFIDEPTQTKLSERPLVNILLSNPEYLDQYHVYLRQTTQNYLSIEYLQKEIQSIDLHISTLVKTDPTSFYTFEEYKNNITSTQVDATNENSIQEITTNDDTNLQEKLQNMSPHEHVSPLLVVAQQMTSAIQDQLSGSAPSTNYGEGSSNHQNNRRPFRGDQNQGERSGFGNPPPMPPGDKPIQPMNNGFQNPMQGPPPGGGLPPNGDMRMMHQNNTFSVQDILYALIMFGCFMLILFRYRRIQNS